MPRIIDADSHFAVLKGLEDTPFKIRLLPDGNHVFEFDGIKLFPPARPKTRTKPAIEPSCGVDLDRRLDDLDREGISKQILLFHTAHVFYRADPRVGVRTARKFNDALARTVAACRDPSRYLPAAHLALQDPEAAADEAERCVKELGMRAIVIGTNVKGKNLDQAEFLPFFARVNELGVPLIIHSDGMTLFQTHMAAADRLGWHERAPMGVDYPVWWMLGHPIEHSIAIARIIYSGMLDQFTNLKFIFEEANVGYALSLFDRLEAGWGFAELGFGSAIKLLGPRKPPTAYLEHFHWAVEPEDSLIGEAIRRWGADRILFSTDYPHADTPWPDTVTEMKEALASFTAEEQAKVFGGNAARLFGLED